MATTPADWLRFVAVGSGFPLIPRADRREVADLGCLGTMASPRENALGISRKRWSCQTWQMLTQDLETAEKKWVVRLNPTRQAAFAIPAELNLQKCFE
jgi:hypothetical protein